MSGPVRAVWSRGSPDSMLSPSCSGGSLGGAVLKKGTNRGWPAAAARDANAQGAWEAGGRVRQDHLGHHEGWPRDRHHGLGGRAAGALAGEVDDGRGLARRARGGRRVDGLRLGRSPTEPHQPAVTHPAGPQARACGSALRGEAMGSGRSMGSQIMRRRWSRSRAARRSTRGRSGRPPRASRRRARRRRSARGRRAESAPEEGAARLDPAAHQIVAALFEAVEPQARAQHPRRVVVDGRSGGEAQRHRRAVAFAVPHGDARVGEVAVGRRDDHQAPSARGATDRRRAPRGAAPRAMRCSVPAARSSARPAAHRSLCRQEGEATRHRLRLHPRRSRRAPRWRRCPTRAPRAACRTVRAARAFPARRRMRKWRCAREARRTRSQRRRPKMRPP